VTGKTDSEKLTKKLTTPSLVYEEHHKYEAALIKFHNLKKTNSILERQIHKLMEEIGCSALEDEELNFLKKTLSTQIEQKFKGPSELAGNHDSLSFKVKQLKMEIGRFEAKAEVDCRLVQHDINLIQKLTSVLTVSLKDVGVCSEALKEKLDRDYEKLIALREKQIRNDYVILDSAALGNQELYDPVHTEIYMQQLEDLGQRIIGGEDFDGESLGSPDVRRGEDFGTAQSSPGRGAKEKAKYRQ
jgi:hypothetical protein